MHLETVRIAHKDLPFQMIKNHATFLIPALEINLFLTMDLVQIALKIILQTETGLCVL